MNVHEFCWVGGKGIQKYFREIANVMGSRGNAGFPAVPWGHAGDSPRGEKIADFPGQLSRLVKW